MAREPRGRRLALSALLVLVLVLALALGLAVACGPGAAPDEPAEAAGSETAPAPSRVVVLAPAAMEMLDLLGVADRVVGVGDYVDRPPEVRDLPRVGAWDTPSEEALLDLGTDLLITSRTEAARGRLARLRTLGIEVLELDYQSTEDLFAALEVLGERFDRREEAAALREEIDSRLEAVRRETAELPRRKVLIVVGQEPLYVAGTGSYLEELAVLAGGENVATETLSPYQLVSLEVMLERRPEVIIDLTAGSGSSGVPPGRRPGSWGDWEFLPAVAEDRVFWVDPDRLAVPGPRLPEMAELMARLLHPETLGEPAAEAMAAEVFEEGEDGASTGAADRATEGAAEEGAKPAAGLGDDG